MGDMTWLANKLSDKPRTKKVNEVMVSSEHPENQSFNESVEIKQQQVHMAS